jgi:hypothetical protein
LKYLEHVKQLQTAQAETEATLALRANPNNAQVRKYHHIIAHNNH